MILQTIVFYMRQCLDKHWMWTIYRQSLDLLLCEENILKVWTNAGHILYMDKLWTIFGLSHLWPAHGQFDRFLTIIAHGQTVDKFRIL